MIGVYNHDNKTNIMLAICGDENYNKNDMIYGKERGQQFIGSILSLKE